jgi:REP element-mobilizing transposase RayT
MGVHIVKGVLGRDHVHMFLSIPPKLSLSNVIENGSAKVSHGSGVIISLRAM